MPSPSPARRCSISTTAASRPTTSTRRARPPAFGSLVFDYTVGAGERTANLAIMGAVVPQGASVKDDNGVAVDFSTAFNLGTGVSINSPLTVASVAASPNGGEAGPGQTVQL